MQSEREHHAPKIDYPRHNAEVKAVWDAYRQGKPTRVPMVLGINVRYTMFKPDINRRRITFEQYTNDPQLMLEEQLEHLDYVRHFARMPRWAGQKTAGRFPLIFQNTYEAGWFGSPLRFHTDQVPDTEPILRDDNKRLLFDQGPPVPVHRRAAAPELGVLTNISSRNRRKAGRPGTAIGSIKPSASVPTDR